MKLIDRIMQRFSSFSLKSPFLSCLVVVFIVFSVSSCVKSVTTRGYIIEPELLEDLTVSVTTKQDVLQKLGSPSVASTFGEESWYYIHSKMEAVAFYKPRVIEQDIIAIEFHTNGTIQSINRYTIKDRKQIAYIEDITKMGGSRLGVMEQLLGNVGKVNPADMPR